MTKKRDRTHNAVDDKETKGGNEGEKENVRLRLSSRLSFRFVSLSLSFFPVLSLSILRIPKVKRPSIRAKTINSKAPRLYQIIALVRARNICPKHYVPRRVGLLLFFPSFVFSLLFLGRCQCGINGSQPLVDCRRDY